MAELAAAGAFAADDGSVPVEVAEVLARRTLGLAAMREVVGVLAGHRLLVPLLEVDADQLEADGADPCAGQDRAVAAVSMRSPGGVVGLAFTGLAPLLAWDSRARPMPVEAPRVAGAVLADGGVALVLDPASPGTCRLEGIALARLAGGGGWPDPWADPVVQQAVIDELAPVLASGEVHVRLVGPPAPAAPAGAGAAAAGLVVEVRFPAGLPPEVAGHRAGVIAERLSESRPLRAVFDGVLAVRVVQAAA